MQVQHTTPKMPTPEPMAVNVGMISNFLACEKQSTSDLTFPLNSAIRVNKTVCFM